MNQPKRLLRALVAAVLAAVAVVGTSAFPSAAIVGGQPTTSPYPYEATVLLDHHNGHGPRMNCGGTLIAKFADQQSTLATLTALHLHVSATVVSHLSTNLANTSWVETNAHCLTDGVTPSSALLPTADLRIGLGSASRSQQTIYPVAQVIAHPWWDWGITTVRKGQLGDIGLIKVPVEVPEQPIPGFFGTWAGQGVTVIGWGLTTENATGPLPDTLQQLGPVTEIPASNCATADPPITGGEFCINVPRVPAGPCADDSGSAGLYHGMLVGSASRGDGDDAGVCGTEPGIYTNVSYYWPWIAWTIFSQATGTPPIAAHQAASTVVAAVAVNWAHAMPRK